MNNQQLQEIKEAIDCLKGGGIIAYPTESIYGLGCDPWNEDAVERVLSVKSRSIQQGLILITANWEQVKEFIAPISQDQFKLVNKSWPGNNTWLFPIKENTPHWLVGEYDTIAIRIPDHPIAKGLAESFGHAIVSTSANIHNESPCKTKEEVERVFGNKIDFIASGDIGSYQKPSTIRDLKSLEVIRK